MEMYRSETKHRLGVDYQNIVIRKDTAFAVECVEIDQFMNKSTIPTGIFDELCDAIAFADNN